MTVGAVFFCSIPNPVSLGGEQEFEAVLLCEIVALDVSSLPSVLATGQNGMPQFDGTLGVVLIGYNGVADARIGIGRVLVVILKLNHSVSLLLYNSFQISAPLSTGAIFSASR